MHYVLSVLTFPCQIFAFSGNIHVEETLVDNFEAHKRKFFCYNIGVPRKRGDLFFVIGSLTLHRRSDLFCNVWRTFGPAHPCAGQNPGRAVSIKPPPTVGREKIVVSPLAGRDHRARRSRELRKRIRRPQHVRNISVLGFVAKPLTLHNEKPNTMVRRVAITRRTLLSRFSLRFLAAPATRRDFEGAPLFFSAPKRQHPVR